MRQELRRLSGTMNPALRIDPRQILVEAGRENAPEFTFLAAGHAT
jgi:hypothetical protein